MPLALRGRKEPRGLTDKSSNNLGLRLGLQNSLQREHFCEHINAVFSFEPSVLISEAASAKTIIVRWARLYGRLLSQDSSDQYWCVSAALMIPR